MPAQDDLRGHLSVLLGQCGEDREAQQLLVAVSQGIPAFVHEVLGGKRLLEGVLVPTGVDLDLQDGGFDGGHTQDLADFPLVEVGEPDRADLARTYRLLHGLPAVYVLAVGLMEQQQVDVVHAKTRESFVDVPPTLVVRVVLWEQLRGHKELVARDVACLYNLTDSNLVEVGVCGVDVAKAQLDGLGQVLPYLVSRHLEDSVAKGGYRVAVVHLEVDHDALPFCVLSSVVTSWPRARGGRAVWPRVRGRPWRGCLRGCRA